MVNDSSRSAFTGLARFRGRASAGSGGAGSSSLLATSASVSASAASAESSGGCTLAALELAWEWRLLLAHDGAGARPRRACDASRCCSHHNSRSGALGRAKSDEVTSDVSPDRMALRSASERPASSSAPSATNGSIEPRCDDGIGAAEAMLTRCITPPRNSNTVSSGGGGGLGLRFFCLPMPFTSFSFSISIKVPLQSSFSATYIFSCDILRAAVLTHGHKCHDGLAVGEGG